MVGRVQTLRSNVAGNRPTGRQPGELYVNWPDRQLGVVDSTATAVDLLAVRYFSSATSYNPGDYVVQGGKLYTAKAAVPPGAFNASQWSLTGGNVVIGDAPPAQPDVGTLWWDSVGGQLYVWYNDGNTSQWVIAVNAGKTDLSGVLPLAGGTMTGPMTLAADPTAALQPTTKQYVDTNINQSRFGGFVNKLRNGTMDIWQRPTPITIPANTAGYTADGWIVQANGAAATINSTLAGAGAGWQTRLCLSLGAASGLTAVSILQPIESIIAAQIRNKRVTFQCKMAGSMAANITPQLLTQIPTTLDNWGGVTNDLAAVNLQMVPSSGVLTQLAYTFDVGDCTNGYRIALVFSGQLNAASGAIFMSECDLRVTPGVPVGLNASPPPPELRHLVYEFDFCCRYYQVGRMPIFGSGYSPAAAGLSIFAHRTFPVIMRASPTQNGAQYSNSNANAVTVGPYVAGCYYTCTNTIAGGFQVGVINGSDTYSAEL